MALKVPAWLAALRGREASARGAAISRAPRAFGRRAVATLNAGLKEADMEDVTSHVWLKL
jgi:hypothetical protein